MTTRGISLTLLTAAAALWTSVALADSTTPAPAAPAANDASSSRDKVVCRSQAAQTGSRIGARRICHTQREWDDIRQQAQEATNRMELRQANPNSQ